MESRYILPIYTVVLLAIYSFLYAGMQTAYHFIAVQQWTFLQYCIQNILGINIAGIRSNIDEQTLIILIRYTFQFCDFIYLIKNGAFIVSRFEKRPCQFPSAVTVIRQLII